ncbi:MAG: aminoglycoside phosphotransferase family protein, partial [Myxococcota bacterium]|nr:aminoglycoside phosphotransferase family protein [Myxococcota bacterium]
LPQRLVVNFADTFVGDDLAGPDVLLYARTVESYRWTTFEIGQDAEVVRVIDKDLPKPARSEHRSFVGVFSFSDARAFLVHLRTELGDSTTRLDPFYRAVVAYHNALPPERRVLQEVKDWRDFGHLDTYYATKRRFFMDTRFFNHLSIDESRGVLRKSSREPKFAHEVRWYLGLPSSLVHLAPRVLDHDLTTDPPYVDLEYYGYQALSGIYLYGDYELGEWEAVLGVVGNALEQMQAEVLVPDDPAAAGRSLHAMYVDKTMERLATTLSEPRFAPFRQPGLCINGQPAPSVAQVVEQLPDVVARAGLLEIEALTVLHGDLCLSNILYDRRGRMIRLVDPRGAFGDFRVHGDPRYDLAKLTHSFSGDYDFLSHGLFELSFDGTRVALTTHTTERHEAIKHMFSQWLDMGWGAWSEQVQLIESLLFLSMIPLHSDRPDCQSAFLARGLE